MKLNILIGSLAVVGIGLLISGGVLGIPLLLGAGFAAVLMACGAFLSMKNRLQNSLL